ncbi:collagen-like protein [Parapedobacter tibetensis]|uniref:collagen-like protein n=1 Tax=Parapedobacter tibetensis TaxID=2972951 RepID=UPI00214D6D6B|nr:collagen-like protein [Parapedobacter tibetensis]
MKHCKFLLIAVGAVAIGLSACKKGDLGPMGPQGEQGTQGEKGENGDKGPAGTANVIYSNWATLTESQRDTIIDGSHLKVKNLYAPKLTTGILNNGVVLVFMRFSSTAYLLPYISDAGGKSNTIDYRTKVGVIHITRFSHDDSGSIGLGGSLEFRYILIPGGVSASLSQVNLQDYHAVKSALSIYD